MTERTTKSQLDAQLKELYDNTGLEVKVSAHTPDKVKHYELSLGNRTIGRVCFGISSFYDMVKAINDTFSAMHYKEQSCYYRKSYGDWRCGKKAEYVGMFGYPENEAKTFYFCRDHAQPHFKVMNLKEIEE